MTMMKRQITIFCLLAVACLGIQPALAQKHPEYQIDFSRARFDSVSIDLCNRFIPTPLQIALASSEINPIMVPSLITVADYPSHTQPPEMKIIYASDAQHFAVMLFLQRTEDGDYEEFARTQDAPPGHRLKIRMRDFTGDGREEIVATSRGGNPMLEAMMIFSLDEKGNVERLCERPEGPFDYHATHGIAIGVNDSLGHDGIPAIEVWQDDSLHFAARYRRVIHQFDEQRRLFLPESVDTFPALPGWCDGRRSQYIPQGD